MAPRQAANLTVGLDPSVFGNYGELWLIKCETWPRFTPGRPSSAVSE
jgi:hypothetical protein